ncbi:SH3 domain-containing protein [Halarcobacter sp.]|uniref:C40 family peptidase n=1 Tax=Halarcobacter sp. TaxID=2321133 RepID=UPI0029F569F1|nr:SH3 domain-containing protein [Halarcobacter sp.]
MKLVKYILLIVVFLAFQGCTTKQVKIADVKNYSQDPSLYIKNFKQTNIDTKKLSQKYIKKYFSPWDLEKLSYSKKDAMWGNIYSKRVVYLENYRQIEKEWFKKLLENANYDEYNNAKLKAITTKNVDFRVLPTSSAILYNPKKAGEGFPFDYNQNSRVKINTPVFVSHFSKDKAWALVQSHYVLGWVRVDTLYFVNDEEIKNFKKYPLEVIVKEGYQTFNINTTENLKVGTFFPNTDDKYLLATNTGIKEVNISKDSIEPFPLEFTSKNINKLLQEFIGEPYGWGGLNNHRDCSSFTQDFFTPFAIYLNRNSKAQTKGYKYIDIYKMSNDEKKEFIANNAIPFLTLIYLRGHIMLYIGNMDNEPLAMHNMWGVRTWDTLFSRGRNIVGKTVITSLEPGIEIQNVDKNSTILSKIRGIVLLEK